MSKSWGPARDTGSSMIPETSLQAAVNLQKWADPMNQADECIFVDSKIIICPARRF